MKIVKDIGFDDCTFILASLMTVILVVQTTWAILDEGQGNHINQDSRTQLAKIAHVSVVNAFSPPHLK